MQYGVMRLLYFTDKYRESTFGIIAYTNNVEIFFFSCLKYIVRDLYETSSDSIPNDDGHFYSGASPFPNDRLVNF